MEMDGSMSFLLESNGMNGRMDGRMEIGSILKMEERVCFQKVFRK